MSFAEAFGCGRLIVGNLFAYRTWNPAELKLAVSPEGPYNLRHLKKMCKEADTTIAAWGIHGAHLQQDQRIRGILRSWKTPLHYLQLTDDGYPRHPLYLKSDLKPKLWE